MEGLLKQKRIAKDNEFDKYEQEMHELFDKLTSLKITLNDELEKLRKNENSSNACQNKVNTNASKTLSSFPEFKVHRGLLIDSASQGSFNRESCVNLVQLNRTKANISVDGLSSQKVGRVAGSVKSQITSQFNKNASITVDALIMPKITCDLPQCPVDASVLKTFKQLQLADVNCHQPGPIDIRLGADVFGENMLRNLRFRINFRLGNSRKDKRHFSNHSI
ncbi:hypothetical protein CDAR_331 [Caerostris darwini]|uniref:Uncharacterized protein n=1 Tax=Caerostris darwini TaxID=1538125 RepID=A0AAV4RJ26_9ARAC|nr:hypothetical protein CDAR_331 [Caerostris darwini]